MMGKKNSTKQLWACEHGCDQKKTPCKHLEKLLDDPNRGRLTLAYKTENYDTMHRSPEQEPDYSSVEAKLRAYGLKEHEVELLLDRYVAKLPLREIARKQGYVNNQVVWRLLNDLTARLKSSKYFKELLQGKR